MKRALRNRSGLTNAGESGVVAVEMAIVLPVLTIIFLTIIDVGLVAREHQIIENAAREGARFSAQPINWISPVNPGANEDTIRQRVIDYCAQENINVSSGSITIDQRYPIVVGGTTVYASHVRVRYVRSFLVAGAPLLPVAQVTLEGNSVFRNLY